MSLRQSSWIEDLVFPVAVAVLTAAWVGPWAAWVARAGLPAVDYPAVAPGLLGLLLVGAALLTRAVLERSDALGTARGVLVTGGLVAVTASLWWTFRFPSLESFLVGLGAWGEYISPVLFALFACAFVWWQGIALASATWPQQFLERSFYAGIAGLAVLFVVNGAAPMLAPAEAVTATVTLFAAGLGALALVSFENARRYHEGTTGTRLALNRYWLLTVASVVGGILASGLVAATVFSPGVYAGLGRALNLMLDVVTFGLVFVFAAVLALLMAVFFPLVQAWLNGRPSGIPEEIIEMSPGEAGQVTAERTVELFVSDPTWAAARQIAFLVLLVALLALALWWSVRRLNRLPRRDSDELRDSIATPELLWNQLQLLFRRRRPAAALLDPYLPLAGLADDPRLMVRRAYQAMLVWARTVTHSRAAGQTPAGYAEAVAHRLPHSRAALAVLTSAYERARYGAEAPTLDEARTAEIALIELQALSLTSTNGDPQ